MSFARWRTAWVAAVAAGLVLGTSLPAPAVHAAEPSACRVRNVRTGATAWSFQVAVDRARSGDRLLLRGTCTGEFTIARSLTVDGIERPGSGTPTLRGIPPGTTRGTVLTVAAGAAVRLRRLTIADGRGGGSSVTLGKAAPGGIQNAGTLVLRSVTVSGNGSGPRGSCADGGPGGIWNLGTLTIGGASRVADNGGFGAAGIENAGTLILRDTATVTGNDAGMFGGILNEGTLTMRDSASVTGNGLTGDPCGLGAAGVDNGASGTLVLLGDAEISGNTSIGSFGGIRGIERTTGATCSSTEPKGNVHDNLPVDCS